MNTTTKITKLKEVNEGLKKRIIELETYIFIKNIEHNNKTFNKQTTLGKIKTIK